jgi:hypothetical protein
MIVTRRSLPAREDAACAEKQRKEELRIAHSAEVALRAAHLHGTGAIDRTQSIAVTEFEFLRPDRIPRPRIYQQTELRPKG